MSEPGEGLVVTDDEYVCLAYISAAPTPRLVSTVDLADADQVSAAVGRGLRSLALRGWIDENGRPNSSAETFVAAVRGDVVITIGGVSEDYSLLGDSEIFELRQVADDRAALVMIAPGGVRRLVMVDPTTGMKFVAGLLNARITITEGPSFFAVVHSAVGGPVGGVVSRSGEAWTFGPTASGDLEPSGVEVTQSVVAALTSMVAEGRVSRVAS